jgi:hypothetical protein
MVSVIFKVVYEAALIRDCGSPERGVGAVRHGRQGDKRNEAWNPGRIVPVYPVAGGKTGEPGSRHEEPFRTASDRVNSGQNRFFLVPKMCQKRHKMTRFCAARRSFRFTQMV